MPRLSTGCRECRRRKVKCDEGKPNCERCIKTKIDCPGYGREPPRPRSLAFVDQTQKTAAKYQTTGPSQLSTLNQSENTVSSCQSTEVQDPNTVQATKSQEKYFGSDLPFHVQPCAAYTPPIRELGDQAFSRLQLFSKFFDLYYPSDQKNNPALFCHYMELLPPAFPDHQPLNSACAALSALQIGSSNGDEDIMIQGQRCYAKSLNLLSRALSHQSSAEQDETFGTIIVLGLCELFGHINQGGSGWVCHLNGGRQYLQQRGPKAIKSDFSKSLFLNIRHASMCEGIMRRQRLFFDEPVWLEVAHSIAKNDMLIEICDIGVHLPTILEQVDRLGNDDSMILDPAEILEIIGLAQTRLKQWMKKHAPTPGPSRWTLVNREEVEDLGVLANDTTFSRIYTFSDFASAHGFAFYNLHSLILARTYLQVAQTLEGCGIHHGLLSEDTIDDMESLLVEHIRQLCRCGPYLSRPNFVVAGHVVALFTMGYLRDILPELDLPDEKAWIEGIFENISTKGLTEPVDFPPAGTPYRRRGKLKTAI